ISPEGKVFTLFDSSQREIRDLALGQNNEIYALALADSAGSGASNAAAPALPVTPVAAPPGAGDDSSVTITITDAQVIDTPGVSVGTAVTSSGGGQSKSAIYRVDTNGLSDMVWDSKDIVAFSLMTEGEGRILVGTGQKGRIYQASAGQKPTLLTQSSEGQ